MPPEASSSAVLHAHPLGPPGVAAGSFPGETAHVRPRVGPIVATASLGRALRRGLSVLGDLAGLVAVAYAFPLVILAIGIPIALLVRWAIWIVRAL